ncbi:hypothetical protein [Vibrio cortegadensis]|uniref:hypothetical protein n=1 Tax=Vibrio cortegadensis TaxID=1328770 RepID=UPI00352D717A
MKKILFLVLFIMSSSTIAAGKGVKLKWEYKQAPVDQYGCNYFSNDPCDSGTVKILKAKVVRDKIEFEAVVHNNHPEWYQCFFMTTSDKHVHIDDELGDEYKGMTLKFKDGQDNKLALNQRKKIKFSIPKPQEDVSLVNLHLGFFFDNVKSGNDCKEPLGNYGINFHKLDWDISELMGN